jgi:hypothetical protein
VLLNSDVSTPGHPTLLLIDPTSHRKPPHPDTCTTALAYQDTWYCVVEPVSCGPAFAITIGSDFDTRSWVGESELIRWYWQQVVRRGEDGSRRDVLLRKLAADNADTGKFETSETDFTPNDLALMGSSADMLGTDAERGMVFFAHDLIADWARFQTLVSHEQDLASYCEHRFTNPHWHTAFRLYGVSLLEADSTGARWKGAISAYPEARDSFLESLVFAGNSQGLVNCAWSALAADKGTLLRAFLNRFQHVASIPNPPQSVSAVMPVRVSAPWRRAPMARAGSYRVIACTSPILANRR